MKNPHRTRLGHFLQSGYTLVEASIVMALMAASFVSYQALQATQARIETGNVIGAQYARVNEGLGRYMTLHYEALQKIDPACSIHGLAAMTSKTKPIIDCSISINGTNIENGLQPTVVHLVTLGLLPADTTRYLNIGTLQTISKPDERGNVAEKNWADYGLMAVITQSCVAAQTAPNLQGRYVLLRRMLPESDIALDEVEVMVNGSNVASSAVLSGSLVFNDGAANAAAYYGLNNLVDRQMTRSPPAPGAAYQGPGLFRSLSTGTVSGWVQLDLGMPRDISNIGLRSAQSYPDMGAVGYNWAGQGEFMNVEVNNEPAVNGRFVETPTSQIRKVTLFSIAPGKMLYTSGSSFLPWSRVDLTPTKQGCPNNSLMTLSSLLFNAQPFRLGRWQGAGARLATVTQTAGPEAVMSNPATGGELIGRSFSIPNPLRSYDPQKEPPDLIGTGVAGIIAVRNGYDSISKTLQTRVDGSNLPTAAWDFNAKNLTSVGNFDTASANVRGDLTAQGALSANQGAFNELKLPVASIGSACNNSTQSLAQNADGLLLTCGGYLWKSALTNTVNTKEYFLVDIIKGPTTLGGPIGFPIQSVQYCINASCAAATGNVLGSFAGTAYLTTLRTDQWFPVVGGYEITQPAGTANNTVSSYFRLAESEGYWSIDFTGTTALGKLKLRFYKINP